MGMLAWPKFHQISRKKSSFNLHLEMPPLKNGSVFAGDVFEKQRCQRVKKPSGSTEFAQGFEASNGGNVGKLGPNQDLTLECPGWNSSSKTDWKTEVSLHETWLWNINKSASKSLEPAANNRRSPHDARLGKEASKSTIEEWERQAIKLL